jgi:hypothetical protein
MVCLPTLVSRAGGERRLWLPCVLYPQRCAEKRASRLPPDAAPAAPAARERSSNAELRAALQRSALDLERPGRDNNTGARAAAVAVPRLDGCVPDLPDPPDPMPPTAPCPAAGFGLVRARAAYDYLARVPCKAYQRSPPPKQDAGTSSTKAKPPPPRSPRHPPPPQAKRAAALPPPLKAAAQPAPPPRRPPPRKQP